MDIGHGTSISSPMNIYAGNYSDIKDAAIIIELQLALLKSQVKHVLI